MRQACRLFVWLSAVWLLFPVAHASAQSALRRPCFAGEPVKAWTDLRVIPSCTEQLKDGKTKEHFTTRGTTPTGRVVVLVPGLAEYLRLFEDAKNKMDLPDPSQLILYVDGRPLPRFFGRLPDKEHSHLTFDLEELARHNGAHSESVDAWKVLLSDGVRDRLMTLSVGFPARGQLPSDVTDFEVDAISAKWLTIWALFAVILGGLLVYAGIQSDMLRVPGASPAAPAGVSKASRKAYSLARVQMAAWFFAVLLAFLFIYLVSGALDSLTPTVLGLMGISAATGLAATIADAPAGATAAPSEDFFTDLVQEGEGMSLPRLQMAVWTLVLIFIFGRAIFHTLVMPEFNPTLLGLMGISGGTYIGFKKTDGKP